MRIRMDFRGPANAMGREAKRDGLSGEFVTSRLRALFTVYVGRQHFTSLVVLEV
jgi:hypothetical protein